MFDFDDRPYMPDLRRVGSEYGVADEAADYIEALEAEVERLRGPVADNFQRMVKGTLARAETAEAEVERLHGVSGEYLTALEEANAEVERLTAALRPFAAADAWNWAETAYGNEDDSQVNYNHATGGFITRGDYRRAAAALAAEKGNEHDAD